MVNFTPAVFDSCPIIMKECVKLIDIKRVYIILGGFINSTFCPDGEISLKILLVALGHFVFSRETKLLNEEGE